MMRLLLCVPRDRSIAGLLSKAGATERPMLACATSRDPASVPHPACGRYRLHDVRRTEPARIAEFGPRVLVFEPIAGDALQAEAEGALELVLHAGDLGEDGRLRRTGGGVRLEGPDFARLFTLAGKTPEIELDIVPEEVGWWRLFERYRRRLSAEGAAETEAERDDYDARRDRSRSGESTGWEPGGGRFGGGGSSGGWDDGGRAVRTASAAAAGAAAASAAGAVYGAAEAGSAAAASNGDGTESDARESTESSGPAY